MDKKKLLSRLSRCFIASIVVAVAAEVVGFVFFADVRSYGDHFKRLGTSSKFWMLLQNPSTFFGSHEFVTFFFLAVVAYMIGASLESKRNRSSAPQPVAPP